MKRMYCLILCLCTIAPVGCSQQAIEAPPAIQAPGAKKPKARVLIDQHEKYLRAMCRVNGAVSGRTTVRGSGVCFKVDRECAYVLTCRHVVSGVRNFTLEFWKGGQVVYSHSATVKKVYQSVDAAVLVISISRTKPDRIPSAVPVSEKEPSKGDLIYSAGCPAGGYPTMFEGSIVGKDQKGNLIFIPPPAGGRSGSGIFQDGKIVGILWGRSDERCGYAVSCADLADQLQGKQEMPSNLFISASWCKACDTIKPVIEALKKAGVDIKTIDYDENTYLAELYKINSLPAYVNAKGDVLSGAQTKDTLLKFYGAKQ